MSHTTHNHPKGGNNHKDHGHGGHGDNHHGHHEMKRTTDPKYSKGWEIGSVLILLFAVGLVVLLGWLMHSKMGLSFFLTILILLVAVYVITALYKMIKFKKKEEPKKKSDHKEEKTPRATIVTLVIGIIVSMSIILLGIFLTWIMVIIGCVILFLVLVAYWKAFTAFFNTVTGYVGGNGNIEGENDNVTAADTAKILLSDEMRHRDGEGQKQFE